MNYVTALNYCYLLSLTRRSMTGITASQFVPTRDCCFLSSILLKIYNRMTTNISIILHRDVYVLTFS